MLGDIELRNVTFRYPARPLVPVFDRFNVHVMPGSTLALVGQSGSGKCAPAKPHLACACRDAQLHRTQSAENIPCLTCIGGVPDCIADALTHAVERIADMPWLTLDWVTWLNAAWAITTGVSKPGAEGLTGPVLFRAAGLP